MRKYKTKTSVKCPVVNYNKTIILNNEKIILKFSGIVYSSLKSENNLFLEIHYKHNLVKEIQCSKFTTLRQVLSNVIKLVKSDYSVTEKRLISWSI